MSIEQHLADFMVALNGERGDLDAWLECNDERECRIAIRAAIEAAKTHCVEVCREIGLQDQQDQEDEGSYAAGKKAGAIKCADTLSQTLQVQ
jgi:hypothetical protein